MAQRKDFVLTEEELQRHDNPVSDGLVGADEDIIDLGPSPLPPPPIPTEEYRSKPPISKQKAASHKEKRVVNEVALIKSEDDPPMDDDGVFFKEDVKDLSLIENTFDKRITDKQIKDKKDSLGSNHSGRLLERKDVELKTELNDVEIVNISKIMFISQKYDIAALDDFVENLMTLKVSRNRKGRREFIQGLHAEENRETGGTSFWNRLLPFGGGGNG